MNTFDLGCLAILAYSCSRGYRRGLAVEADRLIRMALALLAGTALFGWFSDLLIRLLSLGETFARPLCFLGITTGTWFGMRSVRKRIVATLSERAGSGVQAWGGTAAAGVKSLLALAAVTTALSLSAWMPFHEKASDSVLGRVMSCFTAGS